jgi:hypothetical protein
MVPAIIGTLKKEKISGANYSRGLFEAGIEQVSFGEYGIETCATDPGRFRISCEITEE